MKTNVGLSLNYGYKFPLTIRMCDDLKCNNVKTGDDKIIQVLNKLRNQVKEQKIIINNNTKFW